MKCIFCKNDTVSIITDRSYEKHLGENVFFEYKLLKCDSCRVEFLNDELSEFNAHSHAEMHRYLEKKLFKVNLNFSEVFSYQENSINTMMRSKIYGSPETTDHHSIRISKTKKEIDLYDFPMVKSTNTSNSCYA